MKDEVKALTAPTLFVSSAFLHPSSFILMPNKYGGEAPLSYNKYSARKLLG
jgi:hypothetical protein